MKENTFCFFPTQTFWEWKNFPERREPKFPCALCSAHLTRLLSSTSTISQWPHSSQRDTGRLRSLFGSCAGQKSGLSCGASAARETTLKPKHHRKASLVEQQLRQRQWVSHIRTFNTLCSQITGMCDRHNPKFDQARFYASMRPVATIRRLGVPVKPNGLHGAFLSTSIMYFGEVTIHTWQGDYRWKLTFS